MSTLNFGGFKGQDFLDYSDKMVEQLQIHKYNLSRAKDDAKKEILGEIAKIVKIYLVRCNFDIYDRLAPQRLQLLLKNERDQYEEQV